MTLIQVTPIPQEKLQSHRLLGPRLNEHLLLFLPWCDCLSLPVADTMPSSIFYPHCSVHSLYALTLDFSMSFTIQAEASLTLPTDRIITIAQSLGGDGNRGKRTLIQKIGNGLEMYFQNVGRGANTTRKKHRGQLKGNQVEHSEGIGLDDTFS